MKTTTTPVPVLGRSESLLDPFDPHDPYSILAHQADRARREEPPFYLLSPSSTMGQAPLINSALNVIFFDNRVENGRLPEIFRGIFASGDLKVAFGVAEAHLGVDLDVSLDRAVDKLERQNLSTICELIEAARAVNRLRQSKRIEYLIPNEVLGHLKRTIQTFAGHKRKYDELLDQIEREAQQRAAAKRVNNIFGREERARRRDGLKELESELDKKN